MSTGRSNVMDALPHASLLTYFRRPNARQQRHMSRYYKRAAPPPPYSAACTQDSHLPRIPEAVGEGSDAIVDLESQLSSHSGSKNEDEESDEGDEEDGEGCRRCFTEIMSWIVYALLILLVVLNVDAFISRLGARSSSTSQGMKFCLETLDRDAPDSRVWRYMAPYSHEYCTTQIATLAARSDDERKFHSDDKILFGDETASTKSEVNNWKSTGSAPDRRRSATHDLSGDDLAEEGELTRRKEASAPRLLLLESKTNI